MAKDDDFEQLLLLRDVTARTGILHEAQILQLKYYPLITTHAINSEIKFDFEGSKIIFNLTQTKGIKPKDFEKRLTILSRYTKQLLGEEYRVIVYLKGKKVFEEKGQDVQKKGKRDSIGEPKRNGDVEKHRPRRA